MNHKLRNKKIKFSYLLIITLLFILDRKIIAQDLFINEFMASNVTAVPEIVDYDDYPDWIEIYNTGNTKINLSGLYITDNFSDLKKFQIASLNNGATILNPNEHLLFWADMLPIKGVVILTLDLIIMVSK